MVAALSSVDLIKTTRLVSRPQLLEKASVLCPSAPRRLICEVRLSDSVYLGSQLAYASLLMMMNASPRKMLSTVWVISCGA